MQVLGRYELSLATAESPNHVMITTSFYRKSVDAGYKQLIGAQLAQGAFDNYILTLVQALLTSGTIKYPLWGPYYGPNSILYTIYSIDK